MKENAEQVMEFPESMTKSYRRHARKISTVPHIQSYVMEDKLIRAEEGLDQTPQILKSNRCEMLKFCAFMTWINPCFLLGKVAGIQKLGPM
jgi:hypothetical protein